MSIKLICKLGRDNLMVLDKSFFTNKLNEAGFKLDRPYHQHIRLTKVSNENIFLAVINETEFNYSVLIVHDEKTEQFVINPMSYQLILPLQNVNPFSEIIVTMCRVYIEDISRNDTRTFRLKLLEK